MILSVIPVFLYMLNRFGLNQRIEHIKVCEGQMMGGLEMKYELIW